MHVRPVKCNHVVARCPGGRNAVEAATKHVENHIRCEKSRKRIVPARTDLCWRRICPAMHAYSFAALICESSFATASAIASGRVSWMSCDAFATVTKAPCEDWAAMRLWALR